jgi:hypothetical protein
MPPLDSIEALHQQMKQEHLHGERMRVALGIDPCGCALCRTIGGMTKEDAQADPAVQRDLEWIRSGGRASPGDVEADEGTTEAGGETTPLSPSESVTKRGADGEVEESPIRKRGRPRKALRPMDLALYEQGGITLRALGGLVGVSHETIRRRLKERRV